MKKIVETIKRYAIFFNLWRGMEKIKYIKKNAGFDILFMKTIRADIERIEYKFRKEGKEIPAVLLSLLNEQRKLCDIMDKNSEITIEKCNDLLALSSHAFETM